MTKAEGDASSDSFTEWDLTDDDRRWLQEALIGVAREVGQTCPQIIRMVLFGSIARGEA